MKSLWIIFLILINFTNGGGVANDVQHKIKSAHQLNRMYGDLISGKYSGDSDVRKWLSIKTGNYNNDRCNSQLQVIIDQFNETITGPTELWANQMYDASGKIPDGLLYGNRYVLGNFDECMEIFHNDTDGNTIKGQYCLTPLNLALENFGGSGVNNYFIMTGLCIPDTCEPTYFFTVLSSMLAGTQATLIPMDPELLCIIDNPMEWAPIDIVAVVIFSIIVALMIASTVYDVYTTQMKQPKRDLFMAYSIVANGKRIFSVARPKSPDVMNCLNGIRVLSLVWVIFLHTFGSVMTSPMNSSYVTNQWTTNGFTMVIAVANVSVDSFFMLSGLLVIYNAFKEMKNTNGKLNIPMMYVHRYLRIAPPLAMTLLLTVSFISHTGMGPFSQQGVTQFGPCETWWWTSLLFIQNYVNPDELCMGHSWYLQVDMQLFILAPIILIPLWKWGRHMLPAIVTLIALSLGCYFATAYINKSTIGLFATGGMAMNGTHYRMGTWLVGILLGYAIIKTKNRKLNFPGWFLYGAWAVSFGIILAVIFGPYHINQPGYEENIIESALYESLHRVAWCTALAWIIFACVKGYGGYIDDFLSHPAWQPFARLSYSMYLLSYMVQLYRSKLAKIPKYFSDYNAINVFWGDFGITFTLSIFWVLAFESPVPILEKVLFHRKPKPQVQPVASSDNVLETIEAKS